MNFKFFNYMVPVLCCVFLFVLVVGTVSAGSLDTSSDSVSVDSVGASDVSVEDCNGLVGDVDLDNSSYTDKGSCYVSNKGFGDGISCLGASKISTKIEASNLNMYYDTGKYVVAYLKTSGGKAISGQSVKISIDGRSWTKTTDSNGKVTLKILTLTPKVYPCTIKFAGNNYYTSSSKTINVTVKGYPTYVKVSSSSISMNYGDSKKLTVRLLNSSNNKSMASKTVSLVVNGKTYNKTTNSTGYAVFTISNLNPGVYGATVKFGGGSNYASCSKVINVTVKGYPTYVTISPASMSMNYGDSKNLTVRLLNSSNNKSMASKIISLVVNGKTYNKTTNSTGYAVFTISNLNPGVYSATVKFGGGSGYISCSKIINITILDNQISVKSNVSFIENNLSSENDFKIFLKDNMGNIIPNYSVDISVYNGESFAFISEEGIVSLSNSSNKFYSLVTNDEGCVCLRFNLPSSCWNVSVRLGSDEYTPCSASIVIPIYYSSIKEFALMDVVDSAKWVKDYVNVNNNLPQKVLISGEYCSIAEFSYLVCSAVSNIYSNNFSNLSSNLSYSCFNSGSCACCEDLSLLHYVNLVNNIVLYMNLYSCVPNVMGDIDFDCYVYTFAKILSFYQITNHLPSEINFNSNLSYNGSHISVNSRGNISQFKDGANEVNTLDDVSKYLVKGTGSFCEVTSDIRSYSNILTGSLVSDWDKANAIFTFVRDEIGYSFYYNSHGASSTLNNKKGNDCDKSNLLVSLFRALGLAARYCHAINTFNSNLTVSHVWVQVLIDGIWYAADATNINNLLGNIKSWNINSMVDFTQYDLLPF